MAQCMIFCGMYRIHTNVTNEILARFNKEMTFEIKAGVMGKRAFHIAILDKVLHL